MKIILYGVIAGIISATGMGGGTILILLLSLFESLEQHIVQGINLVFFIPTSIAAIFMNVKKGKIDYQTAKVLIVAGMIGAVCGSMLSSKIENQNLRKYFGIFLGMIAIFEIYTLFREYRFWKKGK